MKVAGINGVISERRRATREGVPCKTPEEYLAATLSLRGEYIDILLVHEVPYIPDFTPPVKKTLGSVAVLEAIETAKPRLVIGGHVHRDCSQVYNTSRGVLYICIDSSQLSRHYLLVKRDQDGVTIEKWRDKDRLFEVTRN